MTKTRTYLQIEIGQLKAESEDIDSESDYVTFYKFGLGTNSDIREKLVVNIELFYRKVLSKDEELINLPFYTVEENLVTIGLQIGLGYKW